MYPRSLDVSKLLMAVDPQAAHFKQALSLAEGLADHGVRTTLACVRQPSGVLASKAKKIAGLELRYEGATLEGLHGPQEWMLFLETLVKPDLVQLFVPAHASLLWRAPFVLTMDDAALRDTPAALKEAVLHAHLVVLPDDRRLERLQTALGGTPYAAIIENRGDIGWNYLLAYQETLQAAALDMPVSAPERFELL